MVIARNIVRISLRFIGCTCNGLLKIPCQLYLGGIPFLPWACPVKLHSYLRHLSDLRITAVLLLLFAIDTLLGTLMQAKYGLWEAQQAFFQHWIAHIPVNEHFSLPFFGVPLLGVLAIGNLLAVFVFRLQWKLRNAGLLILHLGLMALLLSAAASWIFSSTAELDLGTGELHTRAESATEWELVFRAEDDSGATVWRLPLQGMTIGQTLDLGPRISNWTVVQYLPNGVLTGKQQAVPMMKGTEPDSWSPVLILQSKANTQQQIGLSAKSMPWAPSAGLLMLLRPVEMSLPFGIQLQKFTREFHPGTGIPAHYESLVQLQEGSQTRSVRISMNHPLRIGDYTIFQSSWETDPGSGRDRSILSVAHNRFRNAPYAATLLIALGLFLHVALRHRKKIPKSVVSAIFLFAIVALPNYGYAESSSILGRLPIQVDGRVKPLETYAHHLLLQLSGRSSIAEQSASQWFFATLLANSTDSLPVFLLENPETRDALGLQGKERDRYSWIQIEPLGPRLDSLASSAQIFEPRLRTPLQCDILRVADSWKRFYALHHALDVVRPNPLIQQIPPLAQALVPEPHPHSFLDFAQHSDHIRPLLDSLTRIRPDSLGDDGRAFLFWVNGVLASADVWSNVEFSVFPSLDTTRLVWITPAIDVLNNGPGRSGLLQNLSQWQTLVQAGHEPQSPAFLAAAKQMQQQSETFLASQGYRIKALQVEHWYNLLDPYYRALLLFFLALLPAWYGAVKEKWLWIRLGAFLGLAALALQGLGIAMRCYITMRPPVTNLYETFVFSGAVCVFALLTWGHFRKFPAAPALAAIVGASMMMLARRYGSDGDTMPVLAAVLDSNFWLTIHVLTITVGYAGVLAAGVVAHWHLWQLRFCHLPETTQRSATLVRDLMALGLLFSFVGTLLGGVWADQSWGRFWGWDPKENGALLIILWTAFLFHAKPAGWLSARGFSLGSLFAIQTVLFAWFGVNLMGVGLHSYGFTQGTAYGLSAFAITELGFAAWVIAKR